MRTEMRSPIKPLKKERPPFFDTIVVGADFSKHSREVFDEALAFAQPWKIKVALVHVAHLGVYGVSNYYGVTETQIEREVLEADLRKYYKISPRQKNVDIHVEYGYPPDELVKVAKTYKRPLIMVGKSKKGIFSRMALGSVARQLAAKSPVPVWIQ